MKFLVLYTGYGTGCDYTIDCNKTWRFMEAESMQEAINELMGDSPEDWTDDEFEFFEKWCDGSELWLRCGTKDEHSYRKVEIFEISDSFDLTTLCHKYRTVLAARKTVDKKKKSEEKERKEYERLKEKFGK